MAELGKFNENLMGQIILSQDSVKQPLGLLESYHYFQLPNPLSAQAVIEMFYENNPYAQKAKKKKQVQWERSRKNYY